MNKVIYAPAQGGFFAVGDAFDYDSYQYNKTALTRGPIALFSKDGVHWSQFYFWAGVKNGMVLNEDLDVSLTGVIADDKAVYAFGHPNNDDLWWPEHTIFYFNRHHQAQGTFSPAIQDINPCNLYSKLNFHLGSWFSSSTNIDSIVSLGNNQLYAIEAIDENPVKSYTSTPTTCRISKDPVIDHTSYGAAWKIN